MTAITGNQKFAKMLAQHQNPQPNGAKLARAQKTLGNGAVSYQLDRQGMRKLLKALSDEIVAKKQEAR